MEVKFYRPYWNGVSQKHDDAEHYRTFKEYFGYNYALKETQEKLENTN